MDCFPPQIISLFLMSMFLTTYSTQLGSSCVNDNQCKVEDSQCINGVCTCKHYYASYNNSKCLESTLLGKECIISEQCYLRVANSTCRNGHCQCSRGFIRFRKHTCLGPAKPGEVCYSDEHCQLYSKKSHCQFLIPKLFGKCACDGDGPCGVEESTKLTTEVPTTESFVESLKSEKTTTEQTDEKKSETEANNWQSQSTTSGSSTFSDPFLHQKEHLQNAANNLSTEKTTEESSTEEQIKSLSTEETVGTVETTSDVSLNLRGQSIENETEAVNWDVIQAVSLGYPCRSDLECQKNDNESRCINRVCDCFVKSENCRGNNTGCGPETFQCRSSGECISWFFVCDGREDCPDKSDEECHGPKCPEHSFQCQTSGTCVSLSVLCDGTRNCPDGEDERFCSPEDRNATQGCPDHTFQCANGNCLPKYEFCNATPKCSDGSDEMLTFCSSQSRSQSNYCPFQCSNGRCRSTAIVCSGRDGCGDNSDEFACSVCRCPKIQ